MLRLQLLSHRKRHRAVIERLVGLNVRVDVTLDAEQKQTALWHIERDLANDLFKALLEEFFADRADSTLTSLTFHQFLIEHLSEARDVDP